MVLMSWKVVYAQNEVHGLGPENVLVGDDDGQNLGQLVGHDVHVEIQVHAHVFERVWKPFVK